MSKANFVKLFGEFLVDNCPIFSGLEKLVYDDSSGVEYVYAIYKGNMQKRIDVSYDALHMVMIDVLSKIETVEWLMPENKLNTEHA